jgi:hypothetical protein
MKKTSLQKAIEVLIKNLKKDEHYKYSWQANIAMSFYDEFRRCKPRNLRQVHAVANKAALEFLNILCKNY